jgi:hypothetical protein
MALVKPTIAPPDASLGVVNNNITVGNDELTDVQLQQPVDGGT